MSKSFVTSWTVANQAPLSMGFPKQEYRSGLPFPTPRDLPNPGIKPKSPALAGDVFTAQPQGKPAISVYKACWRLGWICTYQPPLFSCQSTLRDIDQISSFKNISSVYFLDKTSIRSFVSYMFYQYLKYLLLESCTIVSRKKEAYKWILKLS